MIKLFNEFDKDADGYLSIDEFNSLCAACGSEPLDEESYKGLVDTLNTIDDDDNTDNKDDKEVREIATSDITPIATNNSAVSEFLSVDNLIQIYLSPDLSEEFGAVR